MRRQQENIEPLRQYPDELSLSRTKLKWTNPHHLTIGSVNDLPNLTKLRNIILSLRQDWLSISSGEIKVEGKHNYEKRLLLAEGEIEGLLRKKLNYSVKDANQGQRTFDYSNLLNEKQNQIVELEKKIQNLQEKLRRASGRELELENHLVKITEQLKKKQDLIALKHNSALAQLSISNTYREAIARLKKNIDLHRYKLGDAQKLIMEGVIIPDVGSFDIKADIFSQLVARSKTFQQMPENQKYKMRLVQLFREFERSVAQTQAITDIDVQSILEGFLSHMTETKLYEKMQYSVEKFRAGQEYKRIKENFAIAAGIFNDLIIQLKKDNVSYRLPVQVQNIFNILQRDRIAAVQVLSGAIFIDIDSENVKVVQVPVQDSRTKHLIHILASQLKRLFFKFPKLQDEIDERLREFIRQEIIDVVEVDELEKLVQIVRYVPEIIKVENVYTHSTDRERKTEFHLRILIKALLEQLEKIRVKTGVTLQIDEGVIGMIKSQIMQAVNIDDILKTFRVNTKIVEVQKIVEKIVERVIEIPKVVTIDKIIEKIVEVEKIKEVERIVYVPIEKPMIVETHIEKIVPYENRVELIVEVPTIVEKIVELKKEVPTVMEVEVFRDRIVEVEVPVEIERVVNHIQTEIQQVETFTEKIIPVEKVVEKIIQVPVFVEKIVERVIQVPKVIEVERVVEKIVPVIEYRSARQVENHVEVKYEIVERIVEKIVPIVQYRDRIKQVTKEVQVIKQVNNVITEIKEVEVIREKLVVQQRIKEVVRVETKIVEVIKEVIKEVEKYIQIPIIKQVLITKELIIQKPIIQRIESVHIKQVVIKQPVIIKEPVVVQIEKYVNVFVEVPKTIKYIEERIVEVPVTVDRIKEVRVIVEKLIEKMVQVPRVVQVERIVQKIVVVPRVVEKIIQVPQIIEKIVEKEVIREVIREVQKIVQVPVIQEVIREVERIKNVYIEIEKEVRTVVEKTVEVPRVEEKIKTIELIREVPITVINQIPVEIEVQKIVTAVVQQALPIEIQRQIIVPFEIPVPVQTIYERIIPKQEIIERIIPHPQIIERIVPVYEQVTEFRQIQKIVERIIVEKEIKEIEKIVPYINEVIKEVPTIIEKIVTVQTKIEEIVTAERIIEKVIEKTITIPQIYQVERIKEKLVEIPKLVEIEKIVPQIIRVNQYIHKIVEKLIEVPTIIETMKEVIREHEKVVPIKSESTEIVEVERTVEKLVYAQKLKEVVRNVNYIEKVLQIVERLEQIPVAVTISQEKFIEVPFILEKIVQKIIVMPQIVEVLKYVHEICETESLGVAVGGEVGVHEARYKELGRSIQSHLDQVLRELKFMKTDQQTRNRIEVIEGFLEQLRTFILNPRIFKVTQQKIVEKEVLVDHIVQVPVQDERSIKMELSLSILVEKLILQLKRIKQKNNNINIQLDDDIKLIFFTEFNSGANVEGQMLKKLQQYSTHVHRQFQSLGGWTSDHHLMLNGFLQERFMMAELIQNANLEIENAKAVADDRLQGLKQYQNDSQAFSKYLSKISAIINQDRPVNEIVDVVVEYQRYGKKTHRQQPTFFISNINMDGQRLESLVREKDVEIGLLRDSIYQLQTKLGLQANNQNDSIIRVLKSEIDNLRSQNTILQSKASESALLESYRSQIQDLQARNLELETEISRIKSQNYNLNNQRSLILQNVSFRRQPGLSVQQVEARRGDLSDLRASSASSNSNSASQSFSQVEVREQPTTGNKLAASTAQKESFERTDPRLIQSATRNLQQSSVSAFEASLPSPSVPASRQHFLPGQSGVSSISGASQSQGLNQTTGFGLNQSYSQVGQPQSYGQVQGFNLTQGSTQPQGFNQSQGFGQTQGYGQGYGSQSQTTGGQALGQFGVTNASQNIYRNFGVQQSQSIKGENSSNNNNPGSSNISNTISQSAIAPGQFSRQSEAQGYGGRVSSSNVSQKPIQSTTQFQQDLSKQIYNPTLQGGIQGASQGYTYQAQSGIQSYNRPGFTVQRQQGAQGQNLITSTPIDSYKYNSPASSSVKLTQSILKEQESISKLSAQSPQVMKKQDYPSGTNRYFQGSSEKK